MTLMSPKADRPKNEAEAHFYDTVGKVIEEWRSNIDVGPNVDKEYDGALLTRHGWPDYIWQPPSADHPGQSIAVEVKQHGQKLRHAQEFVMVWLSGHGIDCYVYTPKDGLIPFRDCVRKRDSNDYPRRYAIRDVEDQSNG